MLYGMPTLIELDTIDENLALCRELGLDFIELNMNLPQFQTGELRRDIEKYRRITAQTGVFFTLHLDENLNFADFNPLVREAYCQTAVEAIGIAKELQIPVVNLHMPPGVHFTLPEKKVYLFDAYRDDFMEAVRRFRDLCEGEVGGADLINAAIKWLKKERLCCRINKTIITPFFAVLRQKTWRNITSAIIKPSFIIQII